MQKEKEIKKTTTDLTEIKSSKFENHIVATNLIATSNTKATDEDCSDKLEQTRVTLNLFQPQDAQQLMLAAQLNTIHELQQHMAACAKASAGYPKAASGYINAVTKLSNAFTQQLGLLHKLQGKSQQKVIVEHVKVEAGGQAFVGTLENHRGSKN